MTEKNARFVKLTQWLFTGRKFSEKRGIEIAWRPSVCPSVTLVDQDHMRWKSWKLSARTVSPTPSPFIAPKAIHLLPGEHGEILGRL